MASIRTAGLTKDFGELRAVIDYTREDFADGQRRYDVILDVGGASTLSRLRRALAPTGRLVIVAPSECSSQDARCGGDSQVG